MRIQPLMYASLALALGTAATASAFTITPADISNGSSSYTTADGLVTLTPKLDMAPSTFGVSGGCCFGVGNDQINDADGDPNTTNDQEALLVQLSPTAYSTSLSFIYTRATSALPDGPADDGVRISGFLSDPLVSYYSEDNPAGTLNNLSEVEGVSYESGVLTIGHAWRGGAVTVFEFGNPLATLGQTLTITVADRDEANPQANLRGISYAAIPEPTSVALLGLTAVLGSLLCRRS